MNRSHAQLFVAGGLAGMVFTGVGMAVGQSHATIQHEGLPGATAAPPPVTKAYVDRAVRKPRNLTKAYVDRVVRKAVAPLKRQLATVPRNLQTVTQSYTIRGPEDWFGPACPSAAPVPISWAIRAAAPYRNGYGYRDRQPIGPLNPDGSHTGFVRLGVAAANFEFTDLKAGPLKLHAIQVCAAIP